MVNDVFLFLPIIQLLNTQHQLLIVITFLFSLLTMVIQLFLSTTDPHLHILLNTFDLFQIQCNPCQKLIQKQKHLYRKLYVLFTLIRIHLVIFSLLLHQIFLQIVTHFFPFFILLPFTTPFQYFAIQIHIHHLIYPFILF